MPRGYHDYSCPFVTLPCFSKEKCLNSFLAVFFCSYFSHGKLKLLSPGDCSDLWTLWEVAWSTMGEKLWMQLGAIKVRLNYDLEAILGFKRMSLLSTSLNPVSTSNLLTILGWETPYKWATDLGLWGHLLKGIYIVNTDFFLRTWINWVLC